MARIDLVDLAHSYSGNDAAPESFALKPVTMTWRQGGAYALLGPSGCGKTTLLNLISGIVTPSRGKILFDGADITPLSTQKRNIAQVFQFPVIYDTMTVGQNLAFPLKNRGVPKAEIDARVKQIADLLDLTPYLNRKATRLTADAKQKISLGRGLVRSDVAAVLFDEPLTVIDPELKWQLRSKLKALHRELDLTMIYVTHDQTEALTFADTVVVMHDGRVVQSGTPAELFDKPAHTFVGYFIGSPGMNIVPAEVSGHEARIDGHVIGLHRNYGVLPAGAKIEIGVRPEFVNVARSRVRPVVGHDRAHRRSRPHPLRPRSHRRCQIRRPRAAGIFRARQRGRARVRSRPCSRLCRQPSGRGGCLMDKTINQKAWFLVLPVFLVVAFSAILPLMTVVNYSMQDTFGNNQFFWNGVGWFKELLDPSTDLGGRFLASLGRNLLFSAIILAIEVPLGIVVALSMPREGWTVAVCLVILALPLLIPWNVVGTIWQIFGRPDIGLLGYTLNGLGINYNYVSNEFDAWATVIVMDVWHWTSLVALLCYAGLKSIPDAYYQAAQIDGASRWAVFKAIQLPKMNRVLLIAVLLRFMDSFMIYTEPFVVTGGGPGNSTTFVSIELVKIALGQFDLGKAAALSLVYNLIILIVCWIFYTVMTNAGAERPAKAGGRVMHSIPGRRIIIVAVPDLPAVADLLARQHELQDQYRDRHHDDAVAAPADAGKLHAHLHRRELVFRLHQLAEIRADQHRDLDLGGVAGRLRFSRYRFLGDKHLFFWLLSNRMAPAAVYALPFFNLYSAINLFDTPWAVALAHCIFNVPLAVWILEGFVSGVPREIDETAFLDGYSFPRFFVKILVPLIASGIGVAAFFCFMFSWVELLLARTLTSVNAKPISAIMTRTVSASGMDWGLLAAAGVLTIIPGALVIWFVRNYIARGFALGRV